MDVRAQSIIQSTANGVPRFRSQHLRLEAVYSALRLTHGLLVSGKNVHLKRLANAIEQ